MYIGEVVWCTNCATLLQQPEILAVISVTSWISVRRKELVRKDYMEGIMNEENDWDHNVKRNAVKGLVVSVCREEVLQALNEMKQEKQLDPLLI